MLTRQEKGTLKKAIQKQFVLFMEHHETLEYSFRSYFTTFKLV